MMLLRIWSAYEVTDAIIFTRCLDYRTSNLIQILWKDFNYIGDSVVIPKSSMNDVDPNVCILASNSAIVIFAIRADSSNDSHPNEEKQLSFDGNHLAYHLLKLSMLLRIEN